MTYPLPCPTNFVKTRLFRTLGLSCLGAIIVLCGLYAPSEHVLTLALPIDCTLGKNCFIQTYPDHNSKDAFQDYQCGTTLGYSGNMGTGFRLVDEAAMRKGVNVLASAAGKVIGLRNDMPDLRQSKDTPEAFKGKECGNGLIIEHPDGWKTQYCHLKQNSVIVKLGDEVKEGHILGQVGLSGNTNFPHVHLSVTDPKEQPIDPFTGTPLTHPCSPTSKLPRSTLWKANTHTSLTYTRGGILKAGFSNHAVTYDELENDAQAYTTASSDIPVIAYFVYWYGLEKGDTITLTLTAPDGKQLNTTTDTLTKNKAAAFRFVGMKHSKNAWKKGIYHGQSYIMRQGNKILETTSTLHIK